MAGNKPEAPILLQAHVTTMKKMIASLLVAFAYAGGPVPSLLAESGDGLEPRWRIQRVWRQPEGLPQDTVISILQTRAGYIWVGTRGGLSRFDGVSFTNFSDRAPGQLRQNEVWALAEGLDSSLWIGTYGGGLSRLKGGAFQSLGVREGLVNDFVRVLAMDPAGTLWIGTDHGLSRYRNGVFRSFTRADGLSHPSIRALHADAQGGIWVGTPEGGLHEIVGYHVRVVSLPDPRPKSSIDAICRDRRGLLWFGGSDGLFRWDGRATRRYTERDGLSETRVRRLHEDTEGRLWIATDMGIDLLGEPGRQPAVSPVLRTTTPVWALHSDREGGLWVGFRGQGLARVQRGVVRSFGPEDGLVQLKIYTVTADRKGTVWLGTATGVSAFRGGTFTDFGPEAGLPAGNVSAVGVDSRGFLWVGKELGGLFRSRRSVECHAPCDVRFDAVPGSPLVTGQIRVLYTDRRGAVWAGSDLNGLAKHEDGAVTTLTTKDGLSSGAIRAVTETSDGSLWIGTKEGGLNRLLQGRVTVYTTRDGLPNDSIQALHVDREGTLWIATRQGLSRYKDGRFASYRAQDGLYSSHVYGLIDDGLGHLWMSSGRGIFKIAKRQFDELAAGRLAALSPVVYGREHGLSTTVLGVGHQPSIWQTGDAHVWFTTEDSPVVVDPSRPARPSLPPPVHVEEVSADGLPLDAVAGGEAPPARGELVFRYTAPSFQATDTLRFAYRLDGFDHDWVEAGSRRVAYYTNLPPRTYLFRVRARNGDGDWSGHEATVRVRLTPHVYQTYWFLSGLLLAAILAVVGAHRYRVRSLRARERALSAAVADALTQIKVMRGLLPICATCKKIRDESGGWTQMEAYIHRHSEADFTHGICPDCAREFRADLPRAAARS